MTLVVQSERFTKQKAATSEKVGPGTYKPLNQFQLQPHNKYGFNSTLGRVKKN